MNKEPTPPVAQSGIRWLWIAALVIVADQLSKMWIQDNLALHADVIHVLPFLNIHHTFNLGAAWSFCADCGGPIYAAAPENTTSYSLRVGALKQRALIDKPKQQIFCASALPWSMNLEGVAKSPRG